MTNECLFEGNIGSDIILRHTKDSCRSVLNMILFIESNYKSKKNVSSDYVIKKRITKIPLVAWYKKAEAISEQFSKGDKVRVKGSLRTRLIKKDGATYPTFEIVIDDVVLLARRNFNQT
jgi:single-stranded DNA-binding protein